MDETVFPAHDTLLSFCSALEMLFTLLQVVWNGLIISAHFFLPLCSFNCCSPYFPLTCIPSLLVSSTMSTLPFFITLLTIAAWQKKITYWVSQKRLKKTPNKQNKPDPGKLSTREQTGFSTVVLPMLLKSYNRLFSAWLRFSLSSEPGAGAVLPLCSCSICQYGAVVLFGSVLWGFTAASATTQIKE